MTLADEPDGGAKDRAVLEALYHATGGPNWTNRTNWLSDAPLDQWLGVRTNDRGRVTGLDLDDLYGSPGSGGGNNLTGAIPPELGALSELEVLYLSHNALRGPIPAELGRLGKLRRLSLYDNKLSGPIPTELGNLSNLRRLALFDNELSGPIPAELGNLNNLQSLMLGENALSGPIPAELGNLSNLQDLGLVYNALSGPIPAELGNLSNLQGLSLYHNALSGPIPAELGNLSDLRVLFLSYNHLAGPIPAELERLTNLEALDLAFNVDLSGRLPVRLQLPLTSVDLHFTQVCAPTADAAFEAWVATATFHASGLTCGTPAPAVSAIDVAVFYTPAARVGAGGTAAIEAVIDLMIAETNQAYRDSGVHQRVVLAAREEVRYAESESTYTDVNRLADPSDGHMDGVHTTRDRVGADLVHLVTGSGYCGRAASIASRADSAFALTNSICGGSTFAHELGHNMGLQHERYRACGYRCGNWPAPYSYGYVNPRAFWAGSPPSSHWYTIMAGPDRCRDAALRCQALLRFSNPAQIWNGDSLGMPGDLLSHRVDGPSDAVRLLNFSRHVMTSFRAPPANRPPQPEGKLADRTLEAGAVVVELGGAFWDPDGDVLTYGTTSAAPTVATAVVSGARVTVTAVGPGTAAVTVTATDTAGSNTPAAQTFAVTVNPPSNRPPEAVGALAPMTIGLDEDAAAVDVSRAFRDPDGDALTYAANSSAPAVATVAVAGSTVTVTPRAAGTATVTVTATDTAGSNTPAAQTFAVTVNPPSNRPPEAVGALAPMTIGLDEDAAAVDVSRAFRDPDGDALTYAANSSAPAVATVAVAGSTVTVTPRAAGTATVTVTATDTTGSNTPAAQTFAVTVNPPSNRPPEAVGALAPMTIGLDEDAAAVDVSRAFRDPDGDALTYAANSSAPAVATVAVAGSTVTVTPRAAGTATVTVTATDTAGSNTPAAQTFTVTVNPPSNRPPEAVGALAPMTIGLDEDAAAVDVSRAFRDPDGDALTYAANSSAPAVAAVAMAGSTVTVTPRAAGTATVTVTATDTAGSNTPAAQTFAVTVNPPSNRPPEAVGALAPLTIGLDEDAAAVDVSRAFRDPDGDALTYAANSSAPSVAAVAVAGSTVTVTPRAAGTATVTVTATDTAGSNTPAAQTFAVTVPLPFTDHPVVPGETPVRAVHFTELRARIDALRTREGLAEYGWTDPVLRAGVTPARLLHLLELRWALAGAYEAAGRAAPRWTDVAPAAGATPIRAVHLMELRAAVVAFE